jgi:hypothetical protein
VFAIDHSTCARPDIIAIGFQEVVPLTAQQIVQTDPEKLLVFFFPKKRIHMNPNRMHFSLSSRVWENKILETLERRPKKKSDYVLLRSEQVTV